MSRSGTSMESSHQVKPNDPIVRVFGPGKSTAGLVAADFDLSSFAEFDPRWIVPDVAEVVPGRQGEAVRLRGILEAAKISDDSKYVVLHASADDFHASVPLAEVIDQAVLVFAVDGKEIPAGKGGPFRFLIPDARACKTAALDECANVKFVDSIEFRIDPGADNRPKSDAEHQKLHERSG